MTMMPIGKFARATRLSVKALRNYDQLGLLAPAWVDPESGYRYYRLDQMRRADVIRMLRIADMPLADIAAVLDGTDPHDVLSSHLESLARQRDEQERKLRYLEQLITRKDVTVTREVVVKSVEPQRVASHRTTTTYEQVFTAIPEGFALVFDRLQAAYVHPAGIPFTVFHRAPDAEGPGEVEMCIPVAPNTASIATVEVAGGPVAAVVHQGPYDEMGPAYEALARWIAEHGHEAVGPTREIYLNHPDDVEPAGLLTELQWPIDAADKED
jgi:DNA-binding transcriptional MerR regulator